MKTVKNFSRHRFNGDQRCALLENNYTPEDGARSPFFKNARDLTEQTQGEIASIVAPMGMLLEALATGHIFGWDTTIINWIADEDARKRGRFAVRGMQVFQVQDGKVILLNQVEIDPLVESDFKTGEEFPYGSGAAN